MAAVFPPPPAGRIISSSSFDQGACLHTNTTTCEAAPTLVSNRFRGGKNQASGEERLARAAETDFGKCDHVVMAPRVGTAPLARARMTPRRRVPYRNRW